jgi:hypothetical protein
MTDETRRRLLLTLPAAGAALSLGRTASADQPHMHKALELLREALGELEKADADKGGFRAKAMRNVKEAIANTEKGVSFDRKH